MWRPVEQAWTDRRLVSFDAPGVGRSPSRLPPPTIVQRHGADRAASRPRILGYYGQVAAVACWSSLPWLAEIAAPTLVVTGGDDPLQPLANGAMLARRIPQARLVVHPADGHLLL